MSILPNLPMPGGRTTASSSQGTMRTRFKTPYYKISIGSTISNMVALPLQLHKLIEKVDIQFTMEHCAFNQAVVTFVEGSREPFFINAEDDTSRTYFVNDGTSSFLTNRTGMLGDLKFANSGNGFTDLSAAEALLPASLTSSSFSETGSSAPVIDNSITFPRVAGDNYVLKQGNYVKVEWGYLDDPNNVNVFIGNIRVVQYEFPENDQPKLTITVQDYKSILEQITPAKAQFFGLPIPSGLDPSSGPLFQYQDRSISEIIEEIAIKIGASAIVSANIESDTLSEAVKIWPRNMNLHQFLTNLASRYDCVYAASHSKNQNKPVLIFMKRSEYFSKEILPSSYFEFKGQDSIVKQVNFRIDYGSTTGYRASGVSNEGEIVEGAAAFTVDLAMHQGEQIHDTHSAKDDQFGAQALANFANDEIIGKSETVPFANAGNIQSTSQRGSTCVGRGIVAVDFTTLGHPLIIPGPIRLTGLGKRYSGGIKVYNVTHTIDNSGYICKCTGFSEGGPSGLIPASSPAEIQESNEQIDVGIADSVDQAQSVLRQR